MVQGVHCFHARRSAQKKSTGALNYKLFSKQEVRQGLARRSECQEGDFAETKCERLEAYRYRMVVSSTQRYTLIRMQLIMGRTHQIRVHLAEFARELGLKIRGYRWRLQVLTL